MYGQFKAAFDVRLARVRAAQELYRRGVPDEEIALIIGCSLPYARVISRYDHSDVRAMKGRLSEIAREFGFSAQRAWAIAMEASGRCRLCGSELPPERKSRCAACLRRELERRKKRKKELAQHAH